MGLDISFYKKKKESDYSSEDPEVAYFRKHNWLLPYFSYYDNCSNVDITKDKMEWFVKDAESILNEQGERKEFLAESLIPPTSGFFFGSTDIDEFYYECLEEDVNKFSKILEETNFDEEQVYMNCWW